MRNSWRQTLCAQHASWLTYTLSMHQWTAAKGTYCEKKYTVQGVTQPGEGCFRDATHLLLLFCMPASLPPDLHNNGQQCREAPRDLLIIWLGHRIPTSGWTATTRIKTAPFQIETCHIGFLPSHVDIGLWQNCGIMLSQIKIHQREKNQQSQVCLPFFNKWVMEQTVHSHSYHHHQQHHRQHHRQENQKKNICLSRKLLSLVNILPKDKSFTKG